ncbi:MAG: Rab family GTPase [Promethearchaeota archaeon]
MLNNKKKKKNGFGPDVTFKICIFGDGGVGKTTMANRFITGMFKIDTMMTLGANILIKHLNVNDLTVALQIWDFGGEDMYRNLLSSYSMGASGGIIMFDITRIITYHHATLWLNDFKKTVINNQYVPIIVVGGKIDLNEKRSVSLSAGNEFKEKHGLLDFIECSSRTGENVDYIFQRITRELLETVDLI